MLKTQIPHLICSLSGLEESANIENSMADSQVLIFVQLCSGVTPRRPDDCFHENAKHSKETNTEAFTIALSKIRLSISFRPTPKTWPLSELRWRKWELHTRRALTVLGYVFTLRASALDKIFNKLKCIEVFKPFSPGKCFKEAVRPKLPTYFSGLWTRNLIYAGCITNVFTSQFNFDGNFVSFSPRF